MVKKIFGSSDQILLKTARSEAENILRRQIEQGKIILDSSIQTISNLKAAEKQYNHWNSKNFEILKKLFSHDHIAKDYAAVKWSIGKILISDLKLEEKVENLHNNISRKLAKLDSIKASLEYLKSDDLSIETASAKRVFLVHGTDCDTKEMVLDFLNELGLQLIIMSELAAAGKTIVEEIQKRDDVKYAIVLLTPDEVGSLFNQQLNFRASQNVILELGIFVGRLGRNNVSSLYAESVELPRDHHDFNHIMIDRNDEWKQSLKAELTNAGFIV